MSLRWRQVIDSAELVAAWGLAAVAEVAYIDGQGAPRVTAVTPLVLDGAPTVALPYARRELAVALAAAAEVAVAVSDSRLAGRGWRPWAACGTARVDEDPDGACFSEVLLAQELRKHPPSRALLDTPVLRREYWWYVPRCIVRFSPQQIRAVGRRGNADDGVLAYAAGPSLEVDTVAVAGWDDDPVGVTSLRGDARRSMHAPATLFTHDFTVPDLDRWVQQSLTGQLRGGLLHVDSRAGSRTLAKPLSLRRRLRRLRELERACRRGLRGET